MKYQRDPILELATRTDSDVMDLIDLAATDEEAAAMLEVLDEVEAEERAAGIVGRLRQQGHTL